MWWNQTKTGRRPFPIRKRKALPIIPEPPLLVPEVAPEPPELPDIESDSDHQDEEEEEEEEDVLNRGLARFRLARKGDPGISNSDSESEDSGLESCASDDEEDNVNKRLKKFF